MTLKATPNISPSALSSLIKQWGKALGFADVGITDGDLSRYEADYFNWIGQNFHGEMHYMAQHGTKRTRPSELEPGTVSIISVRMNYLDLNASSPIKQLHQSQQGYISRYALGKDYHKLMRKRLQQLAEKIANEAGAFRYRAFADSAPVLERPLAHKAGLGFIGKNSLIIHPRAGSWFFLGELYTNLDLKIDSPFEKQGCGPCTACIQECPTQAILDNAVIDANRCVSYLTIEYSGSIPQALRPLIGNRIYGCDDCQLVCPWNKFTDDMQESAFKPMHSLDQISLMELWAWDETMFLKRFEGSPIRRMGFAQWTRNLAVSLGNIQAENDVLQPIVEALPTKLGQINPLVDEHIDWAMTRLQQQMALNNTLCVTSEVTPALGLQERAITHGNTLKPYVAPKYYLAKP